MTTRRLRRDKQCACAKGAGSRRAQLAEELRTASPKSLYDLIKDRSPWTREEVRLAYMGVDVSASHVAVKDVCGSRARNEGNQGTDITHDE
jgi:hypothetical protein